MRYVVEKEKWILPFIACTKCSVVVLCLLKHKWKKNKKEGWRWKNKKRKKKLWPTLIIHTWKIQFFLSPAFIKKLVFEGSRSNIEIAWKGKEKKKFRLSDCQHLWLSICQKIIRNFYFICEGVGNDKGRHEVG